ncbi:MAG: hypothetical protein ACJ735_17960 [Actinomycetes bacterium]
MPFRASAARLGLVAAAAAAFTVTAPGPHSAVAASSRADLTAKPGAGIPGTAVVVTGKIPAEAGHPYSVSQLYTNSNVARVEQNEPQSGGVAGSDGTVTATVSIPAGAARSDLLRPYGSWQYDEVLFNFGCPAPAPCSSYGANVNVLPIRTDEHLALETLSPRTGSTLRMTVTNCVGGILSEFTRVIDGNGAYFPITGSLSGTTFTGSADLSNGFRGRYGPQGPAHVSSPLGVRDSLAAVPCAQSEGPPSVAAADHLEHLSMVVDITVCPRTGTCRMSSAIAPAGQPAVVRAPRDASNETVVPAAAPAATAVVVAEPTFVG